MDIYLDVDFLDNSEVAYSGSGNYVGISGKGLTTYLYLRDRRRSNKKQRESTSNNGVVPQYSVKILE